MIKILFFAQTREIIGMSSTEVSDEWQTVEQVRQHLAARGERWALALQAEKLLAALNQTLVPLESAVKSGDEIAFFPPVTGG